MHKVTFYPIGNADCCKIDLDCGFKLLFDYANPSLEEGDKRIDLKTSLLDELQSEDRDYFDVVGFTHADDDHVHGASEFFYLEHAKKYQGEDRIKISELWVPAAMIIEEGIEGDAKILRAEARYRLKEGKGIRVFSRPEKLSDWLKKEGIDIEDRRHLITDAGQIIPGFTKGTQGLEFFVHSPFAFRNENGDLIDRNEDSLILQLTFDFKGKETKFILIGDTTHEIITDIVNITKYHKREERLSWDIFDVPHHCSYLALNSEKGKDKTEPVNEVEWLMNQGNKGGIIVSPSKPIPSNDNDPQPPHRQAANYYKAVANTISGEFRVTMEHPKESNPAPLVIEIDSFGATLKKSIAYGAATITSHSAPRAGV